jgi:hypothetical protein
MKKRKRKEMKRKEIKENKNINKNLLHFSLNF